MASDILVVDDEADIRELVSGILEDEGHRCRLARDSDEALRTIEERRPNLVILDIWLQGSRLDGLEVLSIIKRIHPDLPVVIISGHGNIETAVTAIKRGAYDYIEKPFKADRLVLVTLRALEASQLRREVKHLKERSTQSAEMIGKSTAMNQLRSQIERVAPTNSRILIRGASGSGKELVARVLHAKSQRADRPFVVLNAAAMAPDRVEEELFGTEDRTGGPRKVGALEEAHGGTLYIDEVADMPLETQGKVLRVLVEQKFLRLGGTQKVSVDVRIISSTSRDLEREMAEGRFREDLYHRLNVVPLRVPGLAERREDIADLIEYFVQQIAETSGLAARRIGEDAIAVLQAHDWPGNVRELRNNIERLMILAGGAPDAVITADMLPEEIGSNVPLPVNGGAEHLMSLPLREAREIFER
ncbi:MAG TPA: sigma-54 dependent transcriptional regulator, partial [Hyphomicrobiaceae bacterium]|nr:sigma-54 dependent transcriptional regulator [Hyphomicrobiaceae bacterium]